MTVEPAVALSVALMKIDEAANRLEEAGRYARDFDARIRPLIGEVRLLKREIEVQWRNYLQPDKK